MPSSSTQKPPHSLEEILKHHRLEADEALLERLSNDPLLAGLSPRDIEGKAEKDISKLLLGEYYYRIAQALGVLASEFIRTAQEQISKGEWFDHRHHVLHPEKWFSDYWTLSADNVIPVLPLGGTLLNLCSGDGYYDYHFYRKRAGRIVGVDTHPEALRHAQRLHSAPNIEYISANVLTYEPVPNAFDVVLIRGAIEHFSMEEQQTLFRTALKALKPGGWFCGDTVTPCEELKDWWAHKYEWKDEAEMRRELGKVFSKMETFTLVSKDRSRLFWRCQK